MPRGRAIRAARRLARALCRWARWLCAGGRARRRRLGALAVLAGRVARPGRRCLRGARRAAASRRAPDGRLSAAARWLLRALPRSAPALNSRAVDPARSRRRSRWPTASGSGRCPAARDRAAPARFAAVVDLSRRAAPAAPAARPCAPCRCSTSWRPRPRRWRAAADAIERARPAAPCWSAARSAIRAAPRPSPPGCSRTGRAPDARRASAAVRRGPARRRARMAPRTRRSPARCLRPPDPDVRHRPNPLAQWPRPDRRAAGRGRGARRGWPVLTVVGWPSRLAAAAAVAAWLAVAGAPFWSAPPGCALRVAFDASGSTPPVPTRPGRLDAALRRARHARRSDMRHAGTAGCCRPPCRSRRWPRGSPGRGGCSCGRRLLLRRRCSSRCSAWPRGRAMSPSSAIAACAIAGFARAVTGRARRLARLPADGGPADLLRQPRQPWRLRADLDGAAAGAARRGRGRSPAPTTGARSRCAASSASGVPRVLIDRDPETRHRATRSPRWRDALERGDVADPFPGRHAQHRRRAAAAVQAAASTTSPSASRTSSSCRSGSTTSTASCPRASSCRVPLLCTVTFGAPLRAAGRARTRTPSSSRARAALLALAPAAGDAAMSAARARPAALFAGIGAVLVVGIGRRLRRSQRRVARGRPHADRSTTSTPASRPGG